MREKQTMEEGRKEEKESPTEEGDKGKKRARERERELSQRKVEREREVSSAVNQSHDAQRCRDNRLGVTACRLPGNSDKE